MDISLLEETIMLYTETKELQKYQGFKTPMARNPKH